MLRRGYDPTPYLPALTGRIVGDAETSDRFLWDFRRTLADISRAVNNFDRNPSRVIFGGSNNPAPPPAEATASTPRGANAAVPPRQRR